MNQHSVTTPHDVGCSVAMMIDALVGYHGLRLRHDGASCLSSELEVHS